MRHKHPFGHSRLPIPLPLLMFLAAALGFGLLVMLLWNAVLPPLLGVAQIGFFQALGLLILCRVLFGGVSGFGGPEKFGEWGDRGRHVRDMRERWHNMSPEEREEFARKRQEFFQARGHGFHGRGAHCRRGQDGPADLPGRDSERFPGDFRGDVRGQGRDRFSGPFPEHGTEAFAGAEKGEQPDKASAPNDSQDKPE